MNEKKPPSILYACRRHQLRIKKTLPLFGVVVGVGFSVCNCVNNPLREKLIIRMDYSEIV